MPDKVGDQNAQDVEIVDPTSSNRAEVTSDGRLKVDSASGGGVTQDVVITDPDDSGKQAHVDSGGRLYVAAVQPEAPPGTDEVIKGGQATILKEGGTDDYTYTITNGKTLTIIAFRAGAYLLKEGNIIMRSKVELWDDPNGDGTGMALIDVFYFDGESNGDRAERESQTYVGDGTARIMMRTTNWSSFTIETFRQFVGFEETT